MGDAWVFHKNRKLQVHRCVWYLGTAQFGGSRRFSTWGDRGLGLFAWGVWVIVEGVIWGGASSCIVGTIGSCSGLLLQHGGC